jgi:hypothetical protein
MPDSVDKKADVHFLVDEFGIPPHRAADLIAGEGPKADDLAFEVAAEDRAKDPLAGLPVPDPSIDPEHLERGAGDMEKPVVHRDSAPT